MGGIHHRTGARAHRVPHAKQRAHSVIEVLPRSVQLGGWEDADRVLQLVIGQERVLVEQVGVADLKTRRTRFARVAGEVRLAREQLLDINEFMHPRVEEIADILPAGFGRWLLRSRAARAALDPFTRKGRVVRTSSLGGFLQLYAIAALRPLRRRSLRFGHEQARIVEWLAQVQRLATTQPALALELARSQRLVKGYGDTHERGWGNFQSLATGPHPEIGLTAEASFM